MYTLKQCIPLLIQIKEQHNGNIITNIISVYNQVENQLVNALTHF